MTGKPRTSLTSTVLDSPDPRALAAFYHQLLDGWTLIDADTDWVRLRMPDGRPGLSFQLESKFARPTWPAGPGDQQMQTHLDIQVDDLAAAVAYAVSLGATVADYQPQRDVRVMRDPDGHVFCLWIET
jgi:catechol 2,3-dioxygenase-like lactoylglutathione lyase family enzyme